MEIKIRDTQERIALIGLILAAPAVLLWFSTSMWSLTGWDWLKILADFSIRFSNSLQLLAFAGFPIGTLIFGLWAIWRSRNFLGISLLILGMMISGLTSFIFIK